MSIRMTSHEHRNKDPDRPHQLAHLAYGEIQGTYIPPSIHPQIQGIDINTIRHTSSNTRYRHKHHQTYILRYKVHKHHQTYILRYKVHKRPQIQGIDINTTRHTSSNTRYRHKHHQTYILRYKVHKHHQRYSSVTRCINTITYTSHQRQSTYMNTTTGRYIV